MDGRNGRNAEMAGGMRSRGEEPGTAGTSDVMEIETGNSKHEGA